ncbi:hypothetical protein DXT68_11650 [Microbacterium foliorum]|uniref:Uncharacterized protein n=1 Tax=Microbacterium foliorum TaxID=104336 RepID=A0A0F0KRY9_9MICO|nr:hypothetical protein [Microbacterium foliorum]AXL12720.1 hypothetical protein DXT68_11650 [Microbacterium foliorum]KJL23224.1 hypothetical protein RN50_01163 [Microbacterium foliorum]
MSCSRVFAATTARERHKSRTSRMPHPLSQIVAAAIAGALIIAAAGCSPGPSPTPTPTPAFTDEADAFAAAEKVYRAYNDALNEVDPADPETFAPLYALSSGNFEAADRENFSVMHAEGHEISGSARIVSFTGISATPAFDEVVATACLDVSDVRIADRDGASLVSETRPDIYPLNLTFLASAGKVTIDSASKTEDNSCM